MGDFHAIDIRGRFYETSGNVFVEQDGNNHVELAPLLHPLLGSTVKLYVAYEPQQGAPAGTPGGGSCLWVRAAFCPVHRGHPDRIVQFFETGLLEQRSDGWYVGGQRVPFNLMNGHFGRVLGVTMVDLGALKEKLAQGDVEALLGVVGEKIEVVQSLLDHLRRSGDV